MTSDNIGKCSFSEKVGGRKQITMGGREYRELISNILVIKWGTLVWQLDGDSGWRKDFISTHERLTHALMLIEKNQWREKVKDLTGWGGWHQRGLTPENVRGGGMQTIRGGTGLGQEKSSSRMMRRAREEGESWCRRVCQQGTVYCQNCYNEKLHIKNTVLLGIQ